MDKKIVERFIDLGYIWLMLGLRAWSLMIGIGVLHSEWTHKLPTMGYGTALVAIAFIGTTLGRLPSLKEEIAITNWIKKK